MTTTEASRYAAARVVLETSEDAVERSHCMEAMFEDPLPLENGLVLLGLNDPEGLVNASTLQWIVDQEGVGLSREAAVRIRELCSSEQITAQLYAIWAAGRIGLEGVEPIFAALWDEAGEAGDDEICLRAAIAEARFALTRDARFAEQVFELVRHPDATPHDLCFVGSSVHGLVLAEPALAKRARTEMRKKMETVDTPFLLEAWHRILKGLDEYEAELP